MVVVSTSLDILINLAKYDKARSLMCEASSAIKVAATITDLVVIYREKSSEIFTKACSVLWTLTKTAESFKQVNENDEMIFPSLTYHVCCKIF